IGYGVALVLMSVYLVYSVATRGSFDRAVNQIRQPLYVVLSNGRFQSVMYEPETLAVHYDARRGEAAHGRAAARAGQRTLAERREKGLGDCVDCGLCVQVCPVGIDIRDGLQYKCISCGLCIDACNTIMDSFDFPRGLIRYDSEKNLASATPTAPKVQWKRLKTIGYGVALVLMSVYLVYSVATRGSFDRAVNQIRQPLYVVLSNGDIRNRYQIRITNKAAQDQTYVIAARGVPADALDLGNFREIAIKPGHSGLVQASVRLPPALAEETSHFELVITPRGKPAEVRYEKVRFDVPGKRP
ncbi:MAG: 4Fe-4S dicluster domain-containing protein, partial [Candidatus Thermoplasmatota archaeon]|nr:4Fe-4S dicluster domain-containing protein [Candidatus Thermoplasmatota archaeon]